MQQELEFCFHRSVSSAFNPSLSQKTYRIATRILNIYNFLQRTYSAIPYVYVLFGLHQHNLKKSCSFRFYNKLTINAEIVFVIQSNTF